MFPRAALLVLEICYFLPVTCCGTPLSSTGVCLVGQTSFWNGVQPLLIGTTSGCDDLKKTHTQLGPSTFLSITEGKG